MDKAGVLALKEFAETRLSSAEGAVSVKVTVLKQVPAVGCYLLFPLQGRWIEQAPVLC